MKKRLFIGIYHFVACCMLFLSCSETHQTDEIQFSKIEKKLNIALVHEDNSPECTIKISIDEACDTTEMARLINEEIRQTLFDNVSRQSLDEAIDSFCHKCITTYKTELKHLYEADCRQNIRSNWYEHHYILESEYQYGANNNLCYRITDIRYEGGIREVRHIHLLNFNTKNGKKLTLKDVMQPTYPAIIQPILLKELQKTFKCKNLNELKDKGILLLTDIYVPDNYLFEKDGITFLYNADEIAPYETGAIHLHASSEDLKSIIKQEYKYLWN